jgi:hypothetical protein
MQRESLYVMSQGGRNHFVWATSAVEARAKAADPPPPFPSVPLTFPAEHVSARTGFAKQYVREAIAPES